MLKDAGTLGRRGAGTPGGAVRPSALLPVYAEFPIRPVRGRGSWLIDEDGQEWLDAYGGHAVASTGHSHPDVVRAIAEQAGELLFYSTAVRHPLRIALAERLAASCPAPLERVFFCNSGAEANENALHLARKHTGRRTIVSVTGGWHGRTAATLAVTDGARYEETARRSGIPLVMRWNLNVSSPRTIVCPALLPPWKRTTAEACSASRSTTLPLPSSPHWAPTIAMLGMTGRV